eukprot:GAHX01000291.1.p1 GENE.GAHX01000291.1~~GAHX01000291.1.p1  ORF type:complete len:112 (-),score=8.70 GAHX01000291.1:40-375(-)
MHCIEDLLCTVFGFFWNVLLALVILRFLKPVLLGLNYLKMDYGPTSSEAFRWAVKKVNLIFNNIVDIRSDFKFNISHLLVVIMIITVSKLCHQLRRRTGCTDCGCCQNNDN